MLTLATPPPTAPTAPHTQSTMPPPGPVNGHCDHSDDDMNASATPRQAAKSNCPCTHTSTSARHPRALNVVVTGGSSGIGAAIVRAFAAAGHRVLFTYLSGRPRAMKLHAAFPSSTPVRLDQADVQSVAAFAAAVDRWAGSCGVHVLVNNAALGSATVGRYVASCASDTLSSSSSSPRANAAAPMPFAHQRVLPSAARVLQRAADDEALVKVNALGPLWVTEALMDVIDRAAYGRGVSRATVVFISSVGGGSDAVFPEYCTADLMSKAAMTYHSKHMAAKYAREPVDVVCVAPGATETEMFTQSTLAKVADRAAFIDSMPKRRLIQPDDIAHTVFWLATSCPPGLFHGAVLDASMGLAVRPGLQTETEKSR